MSIYASRRPTLNGTASEDNSLQADRKTMFKKLILGAVATGLGAMIILAPAAATAEQSWTPEGDKAPKSGIYIDPKVDEDQANTVASAFDEQVGDEDTSRYIYMVRLPETVNVETAARQTADKWKLDRTSESLVFYDAQGGKAFIWPSTEENKKDLSKLPDFANASDFAKQLPTFYGDGQGDSSDGAGFLIALCIVIGIGFVFVIVAAIADGFY